VGSDKTLRNESRFFVEDKAAYLDFMREINPDQHSVISQKDTTISWQSVNSQGVNEALAGNQGFAIFDDYRGVPVLSAYDSVDLPNLRWAILSEIDEAEAFSQVNATIEAVVVTSVVLILVGIGVAIGVSVVLAKRLITPLEKLRERFAVLASGEADLTIRIKESVIPEIDAIGQYFNQFAVQLQSLIGNVKDAIGTISSSGVELSSSFELAQKSINKQDMKVQSVTSSLGKFSDAVNTITEQTKEAFESTTEASNATTENAQNAQQAVTDIEKLVSEIGSSTQIIKQLQSNVKDISDVLSLIDSIADQTNLLALNAAIEAARAGEHGRGFAVVADEVRTLAGRTQESTVSIQQQIEGLTQSTNASVNSMTRASTSAEGGIKLVKTVDEALQHLLHVVDGLTHANEVIANSTRHQSDNISAIEADAIDMQSQFLELSKAIEAIANVAQKLTTTSEEVKANVDRFVV
jgi:methyl-accepting chemotaxis protein